MLKKYEYSKKANYISGICGFICTAAMVTGFIAALYRMRAVTAAAILAAAALWFFSKKYCDKINARSLAEKIRTDEGFAKAFFKENPMLKKWYCPKCRSVMVENRCSRCGFTRGGGTGKNG